MVVMNLSLSDAAEALDIISACTIYSWFLVKLGYSIYLNPATMPLEVLHFQIPRSGFVN